MNDTVSVLREHLKNQEWFLKSRIFKEDAKKDKELINSLNKALLALEKVDKLERENMVQFHRIEFLEEQARIEQSAKDKLEMALMQANKYGLEEVNLEYNPKKLEELIKEVFEK